MSQADFNRVTALENRITELERILQNVNINFVALERKLQALENAQKMATARAGKGNHAELTAPANAHS